METATLSDAQRRILWACDAYANAIPEHPVEQRMVCYEWVIDLYRDRFGDSFHHSQLGVLCRAGLLTELHAVRGGKRRYYRLADPAAVRELVAEFDPPSPA